MKPPMQGLVAILQRRGKFNHEKMKPESFPGGCQLTVWGGAEEKETPARALWREIVEEAGWVWATDFRILKNSGKRAVQLEDSLSVSVWGAYFPPESLETLRLNASTGGIVMVKEDDLEKIRDLKGDFQRDAGVPDLATIAMFNDAKEVLAKGFFWAKTITPKS